MSIGLKNNLIVGTLKKLVTCMSHLRTVLQCVCVRGEEEGTTALGDSFLGKGAQILNIAPTWIRGSYGPGYQHRTLLLPRKERQGERQNGISPQSKNGPVYLSLSSADTDKRWCTYRRAKNEANRNTHQMEINKYAQPFVSVSLTQTLACMSRKDQTKFEEIFYCIKHLS